MPAIQRRRHRDTWVYIRLLNGYAWVNRDTGRLPQEERRQRETLMEMWSHQRLAYQRRVVAEPSDTGANIKSEDDDAMYA
jgi:hypothetical protein